MEPALAPEVDEIIEVPTRHYVFASRPECMAPFMDQRETEIHGSDFPNETPSREIRTDKSLWQTKTA